MILWFKCLPKKELDNFDNSWKPLIVSAYFNKHYMKFVYLLQSLLAVALIFCYLNEIIYFNIFLVIPIFLIHELLHIIIVFRLGDVSITSKSGFIWISSNAEMTKLRRCLFTSLPIIALSLAPFLLSLFLPEIRYYLISVAFINLVISSFDLIWSVIILSKPRTSLFCAGYYRSRK